MGDDIRLAGATDAGAAAEILADGFQADPVMRWVFGDGIGSALLPFFEFMLDNALIGLGATYVSEACCAVWTPPERDPWASDGLSARFLEAMGTHLDRHQLGRLMVLNEVTAGLHPVEPHWYLGMLASRTAAQGSGAGSRMLTRTLRLVDDDQRPAYLESTNPINVPFYERHGFTVLEKTWLPDGPVLTPMWRSATSR